MKIQTEKYSLFAVSYIEAKTFLDTHLKLLEDSGFLISEINLSEEWSTNDGEMPSTFDVCIAGKREFVNGE